MEPSKKPEQNLTSRGTNRSPTVSPRKEISPKISKGILANPNRKTGSQSPVKASLQSKPSKGSMAKIQAAKTQQQKNSPGPLRIQRKPDQSSSQDQIVLNRRSPRNRGGKQVPPPQAGVKRFKTQTRENEQVASASMPQSLAKAQIEDAIESSSFAEDRSMKVVEPEHEDGKKIGRLQQNMAIHANVSVNGDTVRLSDHELSIVESDGGQHEIDTPANPNWKLRHDSFHDAMTKTQRIP